MKRAVIIVAMLLAGLAGQAQNEYRITQALSDSITRVDIVSGWKVRLKHADSSSITIITPCEAFFDGEDEPEVCRIEEVKQCGKSQYELTLLENKTLPKSTIIEIALKRKISHLHVEANAEAETDALVFAANGSLVSIDEGAKVSGSSWTAAKNLSVYLEPDSRLKLDTLRAGESLLVECPVNSCFDCPAIISPESTVKKDINSLGTPLVSDSSINLTVKKLNRKWLLATPGISLNGGITAPIPLYNNNRSNSAYNRGEDYRIAINMGMLENLHIAKRLDLSVALTYEWDWRRLLNSVTTDGNSLTLSTPTSGELPQQHLLAQSVGLKLGLIYSIGKRHENGFGPIRLYAGLDVLHNVSGRLVTRTLGSDNRWARRSEKTDVFNPWQLRVNLGIGGGPLTRASVNFTYDLLPTFRKGIGADNIHSFGISISF